NLWNELAAGKVGFQQLANRGWKLVQIGLEKDFVSVVVAERNAARGGRKRKRADRDDTAMLHSVRRRQNKAPERVLVKRRPGHSSSRCQTATTVRALQLLCCVLAAALELIEAVDRVPEAVVNFEPLLKRFFRSRQVLHFLIQPAGSVIQVFVQVGL